MVSAFEFYENNGTLTIDGKEISFISYDDYRDYVNEDVNSNEVD